MAVNNFVSYWQRALAEVNSCKLRRWRAGLVGIVRSALLPNRNILARTFHHLSLPAAVHIWPAGCVNCMVHKASLILLLIKARNPALTLANLMHQELLRLTLAA